MTDKNKNENFGSDTHLEGDGKLSDDLKKRISTKLPDGIDISSIGNIDLREAEKIAYEEIVFLTEDDLIEGLEDFELIPLKNSTKIDETNDMKKEDLSGLRIKAISEAEKIEEVSVKIEDEVLFENFNNDILEEEPAQEIIDDKVEEIKSEIIEDVKPQEIIEEDPVFIETLEPESKDIEPFELKDYTEKDFVEKPEAVITENSINIQFEEIFSEVTVEKENVPLRFREQPGVYNPIFIDDVQVQRTGKDGAKAYEGDPLTERLSRIIHVSDAPMSVITAKSDYYDDHTYILEDTTLYDTNTAIAAEKDEIFYIDPDLDFFENAIVKNDFSSFIQEIDDYYDVSKIEIESQITEILGLNSEERELIDKSLFSEYYSNIDFESEIDFLNPDLDFINRSYIKNKSVSYLLDNPDSLLDEEKSSIEDDITSGTAIVFEEDVEDLILLIERDYGYNAREKAESENIQEAPEKEIEPAAVILDSLESDDLIQGSQNIIDITDQVIILEDSNNVEAFTSQFPDKKEDLAKLFSYLDGLFEKLPEEAVKKFAQSEYFDLYVKVMNEIGV